MARPGSSNRAAQRRARHLATSTPTAASRTSRRCWKRSRRARSTTSLSSRAARWTRSGSTIRSCSRRRCCTLGMHPQDEIEVALGAAYNKWLIERILPEDDRLKGLIYLPFNTPEACVGAGREVRPRRQHYRLHGLLDPQQAGAPQQLHEALCADGGDRQAARLPLRLQLGRSVVLCSSTASSRCTRCRSCTTA